MQSSAYTKLLKLELSGNDLLYIFIKAWTNALKLQIMSKHCSLKETELGYDGKFASPDNPRQNIGKKVEKSSKIRQDNKSLISISAFLLTAIAEV